MWIWKEFKISFYMHTTNPFSKYRGQRESWWKWLNEYFFHKMIWLIWTLKMKETPQNKYKIHFGPKQIQFGGHCQESAPEGGV